MKRFLYWFVWLQLGMPFLVATATFDVFANSFMAGVWYGAAGVLYLSPFLAINATIVCVLLSITEETKEKAIILGIDCLLACVLVFCLPLMTGETGGNFPDNTRWTFAAATWLVTGALVSALALKWEPKKP